MSSSRANFLKSLRAIEDCANDPVVADQTPSQRKHNWRARVFRNGLSVVAFATLEHFLKNRAAELLSLIGTTGLDFSSLPIRTQKAGTIDAIDAIRFQANLARRSGADEVDFIRSLASPIGNYGTNPFELVPLTRGHTKSNLSKDDVKKMLASFDIDDGWAQMASVSQRLAAGALGLDSSFESAANRRHAAAHSPEASSALGDLQQFILTSRTIAAAFDLLASHAVLRMLRSSSWHGVADSTWVTLRFLDKTNNGWVEHKEGSQKCFRRTPRLDALESLATQRAQNGGSSLVIRGAGLRLVRWEAPC